MSNERIDPCLWLDDEADEAADFYTDIFPNARRVAVSHYPMSADNPGHKPRGSVLTVEVELQGQHLTLLNGGPDFEPNPSISFMVELAAIHEVDRLVEALADGGEMLMALDRYPFSERYGWVKDRYGASWQVMASDRGRTALLPALMFANANAGRAEEAMRFYASVFRKSYVDAIDRYAKGEGPEGWVKHGRVVLAGQPVAAFDSHVEHRFGFSEGISLMVMCTDQDEVDHYWSGLTEGGGEPGVCGWLKDRFGVSWQVVPKEMSQFLTSGDAPARERAFEAMLHMRKLDIAALEQAYGGH